MFTPAIGWDSTKNYENIAEMRDKFTVLDLKATTRVHDSFSLTRPIGMLRRADLVSDAVYYELQINQNAKGSWRRDIYFEGATQIQYVTKPLQNITPAILETLEPARELLASPSGHAGKSVSVTTSGCWCLSSEQQFDVGQHNSSPTFYSVRYQSASKQ
ncbi:hypothetical protein PF002_g14327 [Phytophthora fragariae]|uniref:Uncharacterized protein n=1 Tax=Phytophthora fragariae TaxID=53985 RepID=A0A6A3YX71_9STRA|nr:hypothetical protein PF002_g14327 [Phytophthora fragariae]KAE9306137.1 hypothetical protein PF001_g12276 [Phytophthora fragariae]